jgi:hypothetical protein
LDERRFDIYLALFAVEFFIASELASPFSPSQRRRKAIIAFLMLAVFTIIVTIRVVEILRQMVTL